MRLRGRRWSCRDSPHDTACGELSPRGTGIAPRGKVIPLSTRPRKVVDPPTESLQVPWTGTRDSAGEDMRGIQYGGPQLPWGVPRRTRTHVFVINKILFTVLRSAL